MISKARCKHSTAEYPHTGRVITITNYLSTTASHFTQINKGYPLDKDGGRAGVTHYAHAVGSALRTPRALRPTTTEARNIELHHSGTRSHRPIPVPRLTHTSLRSFYPYTCAVFGSIDCARVPRTRENSANPVCTFMMHDKLVFVY